MPYPVSCPSGLPYRSRFISGLIVPATPATTFISSQAIVPESTPPAVATICQFMGWQLPCAERLSESFGAGRSAAAPQISQRRRRRRLIPAHFARLEPCSG
jgi:hypothetical protein